MLVSRNGLRVPGGVSELTDATPVALRCSPVTPSVAASAGTTDEGLNLLPEEESGIRIGEIPRVPSLLQSLPPVFDVEVVERERAKQLRALEEFAKQNGAAK